MLEKKEKRYRRHKRIRAKIFGKKEKPRLCIFRSAKHIYAQIIDDEKSYTLVSASDLEIKPGGKKRKVTRPGRVVKGEIVIACEVGKLIAKKALEKKIEKVVFDRGGYKYHGKVKALVEGAREGGLIF